MADRGQLIVIYDPRGVLSQPRPEQLPKDVSYIGMLLHEMPPDLEEIKTLSEKLSGMLLDALRRE